MIGFAIVQASHFRNEDAPADPRNIRAFPPGEKFGQHTRLLLAADGRLYKASAGQEMFGLSVSDGDPASPRGFALVDAAPWVGRGLPPVTVIAARHFAAGSLVYAADGGMVSDEPAGAPIARAKTSASAAGERVELGPIEERLGPPKREPEATKPTKKTAGVPDAAKPSPRRRAESGAGTMQTTLTRLEDQRTNELFEAAVADEQRRQPGLTRLKASCAVAKRSPELHRQYLAAKNPRHAAALLGSSQSMPGDPAAAALFGAKIAALRDRGCTYGRAVGRIARAAPHLHQAYIRVQNPHSAHLVGA